MSVLDDPNVENVVAVRDFVSTSRQPQTSPPLKMSLTDFPMSPHDRGIHIVYTHTNTHA